MKNISELFLLYKLALIAKEKGFDEGCIAKWVNFTGHEPQCLIYKDSIFGENYLGKNTDDDINNSINQDCTAPLYQQIIDWFIKKNIHIFPMYFYNTRKYLYMVYDENNYAQSSHETINKAIEEAFKLI
jgi:hypothetical protein